MVDTVPMDPDPAASRALRHRLTDELRRLGRVSDPAVEAAFRAVPRELFLPGLALEQIYRDAVVVIKRSADGVPTSSSSQPSIMATMLDQLAVEPGQRVLEIGTGSGYNAALLADLVGESGSVVSVDLDQDLVAAARERLDRAGCSAVRVVCADGGHGWPDLAPYDRIIVTAGAADLPPAWQDQLAPGGRLVLPLSLSGAQRSIAFERQADRLVSVSVFGCGFMPLRGAFAAERLVAVLGSTAPAQLHHAGRIPFDAEALGQALAGPSVTLTSEIALNGRDLFGGPALWLALHDPACGQLLGGEIGVALIGEESLAGVARPTWSDDAATPVTVLGFGPEGEELARRLITHLADWDGAGRPTTEDLRIVAHPPEAAVTAAAIVDLSHARLAIDWA